MKKMTRLLAMILVLASLFSGFSLSACADSLNWSLDKGVLTISGKGEMPDYSTEEAPWRIKDDRAKAAKSIVVDSGVTHIGDQAFQYCSSAKDASIADSVDSIGYAAFYSCKKLKTVRMPKQLDELGESAFDHCYALESCVVPTGVEVIEMATFNCCRKLKWVYIPASVTEIKYAAFWACDSLEDVYYEGNWSDWDEIEIDGDNRSLTGANFHFNSDVPES